MLIPPLLWFDISEIIGSILLILYIIEIRNFFKKKKKKKKKKKNNRNKKKKIEVWKLMMYI